MGNAWSMVDGRLPGTGNRRLLRGYDDVRLWENHDRRCRSDATPRESSHTSHQAEERQITWDMTGCPTYLPPATLMGFQLNGTVSLLTGNGSIAPFETDPPSSTLQVCVTGGDEVPYSVTNSNITLVFGGPATTHFGPQALHGVVRPVRRSMSLSMNDRGDDCCGMKEMSRQRPSLWMGRANQSSIRCSSDSVQSGAIEAEWSYHNVQTGWVG